MARLLEGCVGTHTLPSSRNVMVVEDSSGEKRQGRAAPSPLGSARRGSSMAGVAANCSAVAATRAHRDTGTLCGQREASGRGREEGCSYAIQGRLRLS